MRDFEQSSDSLGRHRRSASRALENSSPVPVRLSAIREFGMGGVPRVAACRPAIGHEVSHGIFSDVLAKFLRQVMATAMRSTVFVLLPVFSALTACVIAQADPAPKPAPQPAPAEADPAAPPPGPQEPKGTRSELSTTGPGMQLGSLPSRYQFLLTEAMRRFQVHDFKGATNYVDRADELVPPTSWSLNVRGAIAIEQHDFDRGFKYCSDALKLDPGFFPAKFNISEIPFLEGKYAEARVLWVKILAKLSPGDPTIELVTYRIFLTYLLEKDFDRAKDWLEKIPFPSQTPAYQYANAAWARQKGDLAKWNDWIRSASYIWPETKRSEYMDVLVQLGWMKWE